MDSASAKRELMQRVQIETQTANLRMLMEKIQENCFDKCVPKPGSTLSGSEQTCATTCMEKYMQAWNSVNAAFINRVRAEQATPPGL